MESIDIDVDEFFEAGEKGHPIESEDASEPLVTLDARQAQKLTREAGARRAHLARYVVAVVSFAAGVLVFGITAERLRHPRTETGSAQLTPEPPDRALRTALVEAARAPQAPVDVPIAALETSQDETEKPTVAVPTEKPANEEVAPTQTHADDPKPVQVAMSAGQAKEAAKAALEHGANGAAISAGERSVVLDGSDAEAWLVLGAAYQATGNVGHAKTCYDACVTHGSKGPVDECRDLLRTL